MDDTVALKHGKAWTSFPDTFWNDVNDLVEAANQHGACEDLLAQYVRLFLAFGIEPAAVETFVPQTTGLKAKVVTNTDPAEATSEQVERVNVLFGERVVRAAALLLSAAEFLDQPKEAVTPVVALIGALTPLGDDTDAGGLT